MVTRKPVAEYPVIATSIVLAIMFLIYAAGLAFDSIHERQAGQTSTPEQQRDLLRQRQAEEAWAYERAADAELCRAKDRCVRYAAARQDCATAGNFENCLSVKLGADASMSFECKNDGQVITSRTVPNVVECWARGIASYVGGP